MGIDNIGIDIGEKARSASSRLAPVRLAPGQVIVVVL